MPLRIWVTVMGWFSSLRRTANTSAAAKQMDAMPILALKMVVAAVSDMKALVKEPKESFELNVRPELQSRVNNSCIAFIQSLLGLMMKGDQD